MFMPMHVHVYVLYAYVYTFIYTYIYIYIHIDVYIYTYMSTNIASPYNPRMARPKLCHASGGLDSSLQDFAAQTVGFRV